MGKLTLVTGGARSGKSARAQTIAESGDSSELLFIATAVATDREMQQRIDTHQAERGPRWRTEESPYELTGTVTGLSPKASGIIDCLTVWLGNIWHSHNGSESELRREIDSLCTALESWKKRSSGSLILVTNEVGWGIVPLDASVRAYRDHAGRLNARVAAIADTVELCVCGLPQRIK